MKCCARQKNGASGVADRYQLLGIVSLEPGGWADWFSGTSSFAAVVVALGAYWFGERARRREQSERELAVGRQIGWKIARLLNSSHDFYRHFWTEADKTLVGATGRVEKWRSTFPLIGVQVDPTHALSQTEEDLLLKAKASDLLMKMTLVYGRYTSIVSSIDTYQSRFEVLQSLMPAPVKIGGQSVTHELTAHQILGLHPYILQLESVIDGIRALTLQNVKSCVLLLDDLEVMYQSYFGKSLFKFELDSDVGDVAKMGVEIPRK
jgi:hypothetical protein